MVKVGWRSKAMYVLFALALIVGLMGSVVTVASAQGYSVTITDASPDKGLSPLTVTFTVNIVQGTSTPTYTLDWDLDNDGAYDDGSDYGVGAGVSTHAHTITTPNTIINARVRVTDSTAIGQGGPKVTTSSPVEVGVDPALVPDIALDVKASVQKFVLVNVPGTMSYAQFAAAAQEDLEGALIDAQVDNPEAVQWNISPVLNLQTVGEIGDNADITVMAGGGPTFYNNPRQNWIEIRALTPGDTHVSVWLDTDLDEDGSDQDGNTTNDLDLEVTAEKKWGVIDHTIMDLDPITSIGDPATANQSDASAETNVQDDAGTPLDPNYETFNDWVLAWFFWGPGEPMPLHIDTAGHAIVHWWLIQDDALGVNEAAIQAIMDSLGTDGVGGYPPPPALTPKQQIDAVWAGQQALNTTFNNAVDGYYYLYKDVTSTYMRTQTQDDFPGETRGLSQVSVRNTGGEDMLIVTLSEYPNLDAIDDTWDYHGENPVAVEMGKKQWGVPPPPTEVKTPQLRWAGDKIVLQKDWGDVIDVDKEYVAIYHLENQSIGELSGVNPWDEWSQGDVWVDVNGSHRVSEAILESEVQGEADVNVKLYESPYYGPPSPPLVNYGFLVYYMAFEDVVLAEDITPAASLDQADPDANVDVAVAVRGWFTSPQLPGTNRAAVLSDDGITYALPAGRYVMPDDWPALANHNFDLRPNMDLMDQAHHDNINSTAELGPFDTGVRTTDPPAMAAFPTIGPFSTLQPWSIDLMWIASAANVPTSLIGSNFRNTVVPDGVLDWYDAPMPQNLLIWDITGWTTATGLTTLDKGNLQGYGFTGAPPVYHSPYYKAEIPAHPAIPAIDHDWNSWGGGAKSGPYDFWTDVQKKSANDNEPIVNNDQDVEVFADNHGIAGVTIDALNQAGSVTLTATAEYPSGLKKGKYGPVTSDDIPVTWGAVELNPHFQADKTDVAVEELVTFTNLTTGGTFPYTKAEWDFDADGSIETTITGTHAQVMAPVTHAYTEPGVYTVRLWMTDSTPTTRFEERTFYIVVAGASPTTTWDLDFGLDADPGAVNLYQYPDDAVLVTLADIAGTAPAELSIVWHYGGPVLGWTWWVPSVGESTLLTLDPGEIYIGIATATTSWDIPQT